MKTKEEIEQLAEQYWDKQPYNEDAYVVGYIQCQQDMAAKPIGEWITMKEGDITVNFKTMPEFDDPKYPDYPTRAKQLHIQIAEECFKKYPNNKELYTTDELKDAYKAGVIDGLKEWTLDSYNPPTKKQE